MVEKQDWSIFLPYFSRQWKQGEHVSVIGSTGGGKSYLSLQLIKAREYYVLLLTKGNDRTFDTFIARNDIEVISQWPPTGFNDHIALWPRFTGIDSFETQRIVFKRAINGYRKGATKIDGIYKEGGWSILIDEVMYFKDSLHLETELQMLWTQGRSNHISLVAASQRPREVPQLMLNQWTHLFIFQTTDRYELDRLAGIGGNVSSTIREIVPNLPKFTFLYINRNGQTIISKAR